MFNIKDGRDCFYQWDINRELIVNDESVNEIHFCNHTNEVALITRVEVNEDGERVAPVPNELLQKSWDILVYAFVGDEYTRVDARIRVIPRSKPSDYVYEPTEIYTYKVLEERLNEIEEKGVSDEVVERALAEYFIDNPIQQDVTSVNGQKGDVVIEIPEVDLSGYATESFVTDAIAQIPQTDLSGYALKSEIPDVSGYLTSDDVSEFKTETEIQTMIDNSIQAIPIYGGEIVE